MNDWDRWAEEQRERNFQKEQQRQLEQANKIESEIAGGAISGIGGIIGLFFSLISLALVIIIFILKYLFIFLVFLRNRFFIRWNWYVKTENAIRKCLFFIREAIIWIIALPFIILIRHFDLCVVAGAISLSYLYGK